MTAVSPVTFLPDKFHSPRRLQVIEARSREIEEAPQGLYPPSTKLTDDEMDDITWGLRDPSGEKVDEIKALKSPAFWAGVMVRVLNCSKLGLKAVDEETLKPVKRQPPWATRAPCWGMTPWAWKSRLFLGIARQCFTVFQIMSWKNGRPWLIRPLSDQYCDFNPTPYGATQVVYNPDQTREIGTALILDEWRGPGSDIVGSPERQCIVHRYVDDGTASGVSLVEAAADSIGLALAVQRHAASFFGKGGSAAPMVAMEGDEWKDQDAIQGLTAEQHKARRNPGKRHLPTFVGGKASAIQLHYPAKESQLVEKGDQTVRDAARLHGVASQMMGENTTSWGTIAAAQNRMLHQLVLAPMLISVEDTLNWTLPEGQIAKFDTSELINADPDTLADTLTKLKTAGIITANESRAMLRRGLPDHPDGDDLGTGSADEPEPATMPEEPDEPGPQQLSLGTGEPDA